MLTRNQRMAALESTALVEIVQFITAAMEVVTEGRVAPDDAFFAVAKKVELAIEPLANAEEVEKLTREVEQP